MSSTVLINLIYTLVNFYTILICVWCLMTWLPRSEGSLVSDIFAVIGSLVTPYLNLFRKIIPSTMGVDFSPVIAIIVLNLARRLLVSIIL